MKNSNLSSLVLTAALFFALLATPMFAQKTQVGLLPVDIATSTSSTSTTTYATVSTAVEATLARYENALNTENATALAPALDAKVTVSEPDGSTKTVSEADFIAMVKDAFKAAGKEIVDLYGLEVQVISDNGARVLGSYTVVLLDEKGEKTDMARSGRFIYVLRKTALIKTFPSPDPADPQFEDFCYMSVGFQRTAHQ